MDKSPIFLFVAFLQRNDYLKVIQSVLRKDFCLAPPRLVAAFAVALTEGIIKAKAEGVYKGRSSSRRIKRAFRNA